MALVWNFLLLLGLISSPSPGQGGKQQHGAEQKADKPGDVGPSQPHALFQIAPVAKKCDGEYSEEAAKQQPSYWKEVFAPATIANWALVWVGLITGYLAWRTLRAIDRQARIMANAERPWVIVDIPNLPAQVMVMSGATQVPFWIDSPLYVRITNRGKGVCRVKETSLRFVYAGIKGGTPPPAKPPYGSPVTHEGLILAPDIPWGVELGLERAEWPAPPIIPAVPGVHYLYAFGYILYEDGHTDKHTTRFGLIWQMRVLDGDARLILGKAFVPSGPTAYNYAD